MVNEETKQRIEHRIEQLRQLGIIARPIDCGGEPTKVMSMETASVPPIKFVCSDCNGTGKYVGFIESDDCKTCLGTGLTVHA